MSFGVRMNFMVGVSDDPLQALHGVQRTWRVAIPNEKEISHGKAVVASALNVFCKGVGGFIDYLSRAIFAKQTQLRRSVSIDRILGLY